MPFIETADHTRLFYKDWGAGKPVVLIHGWPVNADMWEYQAVAMAAHGHRVIAYDKRGFGRSDQPWNGYDYDTFADDLHTLMEKLDLHDAMLVGYSMGGGEVARYLSRHGTDRVSKAVLLSSVTPYMLKTKEHPDGADPSIFEDMIAGLVADRPHFLTTFGKQFFGAGMLNTSISTEIMQWTGNMALMASPKATIDCVRAFAGTDFRPDMKAFSIPTLILHGDGDQTVPIDLSARATAKLIPNATLKEYPGASHATFFTQKDEVLSDLMGFAAA